MANEASERTDGDHERRADDAETISTAIVEALADAADEDPTEFDFQVYDAVDFDALDALYRHAQRTGGSWELEFAVGEFEVVARSDGRVSVR